jgi:hypothetical protein
MYSLHFLHMLKLLVWCTTAWVCKYSFCVCQFYGQDESNVCCTGSWVCAIVCVLNMFQCSARLLFQGCLSCWYVIVLGRLRLTRGTRHVARWCVYCGPGWLSQYSDLLWAGQFGGWIPVGSRFSAPVQAGPEAHPASYTVGTGSFLGVKRLGRGVDHPPHVAPRLKKE